LPSVYAHVCVLIRRGTSCRTMLAGEKERDVGENSSLPSLAPRPTVAPCAGRKRISRRPDERYQVGRPTFR
jgi:hypothetical protein